jgi:hypothetical protein
MTTEVLSSQPLERLKAQEKVKSNALASITSKQHRSSRADHYDTGRAQRLNRHRYTGATALHRHEAMRRL